MLSLTNILYSIVSTMRPRFINYYFYKYNISKTKIIVSDSLSTQLTTQFFRPRSICFK